MAVRAVLVEQFEHPVVVDGPAEKGPPDQARDVQVTHGHCIGIAERSLCYFGTSPHTDAGNRTQSG
jgi:hypothetical protein